MLLYWFCSFVLWTLTHRLRGVPYWRVKSSGVKQRKILSLAGLGWFGRQRVNYFRSGIWKTSRKFDENELALANLLDVIFVIANLALHTSLAVDNLTLKMDGCFYHILMSLVIFMEQFQAVIVLINNNILSFVKKSQNFFMISTVTCLVFCSSHFHLRNNNFVLCL